MGLVDEEIGTFVGGGEGEGVKGELYTNVNQTKLRQFAEE